MNAGSDPGRSGRFRPGWRTAVVVAMFAAAAGLRLVAITEPPLDFHATRQYRSALIARELWLSWTVDPDSTELELARQAAPDRYEPPVLEAVSATVFSLTGRESLVVPRCLSIVAWLAGGVAVFLLLGRVAGSCGAVAGTAFFLFAPFAVMASRSFQPDPWMVAAIGWFAVAADRYVRQPGFAGVLACGVVAGVAVLLKPVAVFQVGAAFVAVAWALRGEDRSRRWRHLAVFALLAVGPSLPYYVHRWANDTVMSGLFEQSWQPHLVLTFAFWRGWLAQVWKTTGVLAAGTVIVAAVIARDTGVRRLLVGLLVGYVAFVMVFLYQSFTHDYFHLQLFPSVAIAVGLVAQRVLDAATAGGGFSRRTVVWLAAAAVVLACTDAALSSYDGLRRLDFSTEIESYVEVGEVVEHSARCLTLSDFYGYPLRYHGRVAGRAWPQWYDFRQWRIMGRPVVGAEQRLDELVRAFAPRFFIVTDLDELDRQEGLREVLDRRYPVVHVDEVARVYRVAPQSAGSAP